MGIPPLFTVVQEHIDDMNVALNQGALLEGYQVADVQGAFQADPDAVNFSLVWETLNLDPYPTYRGHELIFRELMDLTGPRGVLRGRKPVAAGIPATHGVSGWEFDAIVREFDKADLVSHLTGR